jgi:hypothetical protein
MLAVSSPCRSCLANSRNEASVACLVVIVVALFIKRVVGKQPNGFPARRTRNVTTRFGGKVFGERR